MAQETGMVLQESVTIYENTRYSFRNASSGWYLNTKNAKNANGNSFRKARKLSKAIVYIR